MQELGYKGFPILALHRPYHVVNGPVADYMHCVIIGVVKQLLNLWFERKHRNSPFYIGNRVRIYIVAVLFNKN